MNKLNTSHHNVCRPKSVTSTAVPPSCRPRQLTDLQKNNTQLGYIILVHHSLFLLDVNLQNSRYSSSSIEITREGGFSDSFHERFEDVVVVELR